MKTIQTPKIRIRLNAYDHSVLDSSCEKIIDTANNTSSSPVGPIPLPIKKDLLRPKVSSCE